MKITLQNIEIKQINNFVLLMIAILLPLLLLLMYVCVLCHYSLWSYVPKAGDGLGYWVQISAFVNTGFHSGYFCWGELIAPISFLHFSVHGPGFALIYGVLGKIFGWYWYSPPIFNIGFLTASIAFVGILGYRKQKNWGVKLLFLSTLVMSSSSAVWYISTPLQESFHIAIGITLGGLFAIYLKSNSTSRHALISLLILLSLVSFTRVTWTFLFFPIAVIESSRFKTKGRFFLIFLGLITPLIFFLLWRGMSAPLPYGYGPLDWIRVYIERRLEGALPPRWISDQVWEFTRRLFDSKRLEGQLMFFIFVWQTILYLGFCVALNWKKLRQTSTEIDARLDLTIIWLLFVSLVNAIYFYQVEPDAQARLLAGPLFMAVVLHLFSRRNYNLWLLYGLLFTNLIILPYGIQSIKTTVKEGWTPTNYNHYIQLRTELASLIHYDASKSPWCNTVLISEYDDRAIAFPAGIGLTWTPHAQWIGHPPRARYALVNNTVFKELKLLGNYRLISKTSVGNLYENLSTNCH